MAQNKSIAFTKMAGAGNDFVIMDPIKGVNLKKLAIKVCDRTNGIGADGLMILSPSKKSNYRMRIINADGSEAEMCGNGARCMAAYIAKTQNPKSDSFSMETLAGQILAETGSKLVKIRLSNPKDYQPEVTIKVNAIPLHVSYIDTGVPHAVIFVDHVADIDVQTIGRTIRTHKKFQPRGANVNFVEQLSTDLAETRTYERGVEDETKACGTGSVAAGIITYLKSNPDITNKKKARMRIRTKSTEILEVTFDLQDSCITNVWLKGSARFIAEGQYFL